LPTARIVNAIKTKYAHVPVIGFPRGATSQLQHFAKGTGVDGVSCDTSCPLGAMQSLAAGGTVAQGNLDPLLLVAGGQALDRRVDDILEVMAGKPFIFNLGHGIVPETPPEHVARLVARVRRKG